MKTLLFIRMLLGMTLCLSVLFAPQAEASVTLTRSVYRLTPCTSCIVPPMQNRFVRFGWPFWANPYCFIKTHYKLR